MSSTYAAERQSFYDSRAHKRPVEQRRHYNHLLRHYYTFLIPKGARVLEIGSGTGDLLAAVEPACGVGVEFSPLAVALASETYPKLRFVLADAESFTLMDEQGRSSQPLFDYIVLSDLVNDLEDVQTVFEHLRCCAHERTRLVLNFFNNVWHPILWIAQRLSLKAPALRQNWLSSADTRNLLELAGWELIRQEQKILIPIPIPVLEPFLNRVFAPLLGHLCLTVFQVARLNPGMRAPEKLKDRQGTE